MLLIDGRYVPVDPNLNWFGLSAGPAATPDAGTGKHIPGQAPDPTAQYRKAYGTDGTVWLLYDTGETFGYSQDMQQWSIPATDGGFTTITRNVFSFGTPQARFGAWTTTEYRPDGSSYLPGTRYLELVGDNPGNPFLDPATAQDYALATATGSNITLADQTIDAGTGHTQTFTLYASGTSAVDQIIEIALQGDSANKYVCTADGMYAFDAGGKATVTIPAGQDRIVLELLDTSITPGTDTFSFMATLIDPDAAAGSTPVSSNIFNVSFDIPDQPAIPATTRTILGDFAPAVFTTEQAANASPDPTWTVLDRQIGSTHIAYTDTGGSYEVIDTYIYTHWTRDDLGNWIAGAAAPDRDDDLIGSGGNDYIDAGGGHNNISAGAGNDYILGGNAGDYIDAGLGDDYIEAGAGNDRVHAYNGNDILIGGAGSDILDSGVGDDRLYADTQLDTATAIAQGNSQTGTGVTGDWLNAGDGNDILIGSNGNDLLAGGAGDDLLIGGAGDDVLLGDNNDYPNVFPEQTWHYDELEQDLILDNIRDHYPSEPATSGNDVLYAGAGNDYASGGYGDDVIYGEADDDILEGNSGNDMLFGGSGKDRLYGDLQENYTIAPMPGNDYLDGGDDDDLIYGNEGNDTLLGGAGNDILWGGSGNDTLFGGAGDDTLNGEEGANYLDGGDGTDDLNSGGPGSSLFGGAGNDILEAVGGNNYLDGEDGNDTLIAVDGNNTLFGGAGNDDLQAGGGNSYLDGDEGDNTLFAEGGNNTLFAGAGDDTLQAAGGNSYLDGGDGTNTLAADGGGNTLYGGTGNDILSSGGGGSYLDAGDGNNQIVADGGGNTLISGSGDDILTAEGGNNTLDGGAGADTLIADGGGGNYLNGGDGADTLIADGGGNTLSGGAGDDILHGGVGNDILQGGAGRDIYIYNRGDGRDTIVDDQADNNIVYFGAGIGANDITLHLGSLMLDLGNGDEIHIDGFDRNDVFNSASIGSFVFADGSTLSTAELLARGFDLGGTSGDDVITGTNTTDRISGAEGNDVLHGAGGDDELSGGAGSDMLFGGAGDDTYRVNMGDGFDVIEDTQGANTIEFGAGITRDSVHLSQYQGDDGAYYLYVEYGSAGDGIAIKNGLLGGIQTFRFADDTSATYDEMVDAAGIPFYMPGTEGNDIAQGSDSADTADGKGGDDRIYGRGGDDRLAGGSGTDMLDGGAGDDFLDGGTGNDLLLGGAGRDSYLMRWGMGSDMAIDSGPETSILQLDEGIGIGDLHATRQGDDLFVHFRGADDGVVIKDYYLATQPWEISTAGGEHVPLDSFLISLLPDGRVTVEAAINDYKSSVKGLFYSTLGQQGYVVGADGRLHKQRAEIYSSGSTSYEYFDTYAVTTQDSDAAVIGRGSASNYQRNYTQTYRNTTSVPIQTVAPGSGYGGANTGGSFYPIGSFFGGMQVPPGYISILVKDQFQEPIGFWVFPQENVVGGGATEYRTITHSGYRVDSTLNFEEIIAGNADNEIRTAGYSVVDAGAGDDLVIAGSRSGWEGYFGLNFARGYVDYSDPLASPYDERNIGSFLYGNAGDDKLIGGEANDVLAGGDGDDILDGGSGADTYLVLPGQPGFDTIYDTGELRVDSGDAGAFSAYRDWYYKSIGIMDWDAHIFDGTLPRLLDISPNDYQALAPLYAANVLEKDTVEFGQGITLQDMSFSWEQVTQGSSYIWQDPVLATQGSAYTALTISWAPDRGVKVAIPHSFVNPYPDEGSEFNGWESVLGLGIEQFKFADGTILSMGQMIALAPPPFTFDPHLENNVLNGSVFADSLYGGLGDDILHGNGGNDYLVGGGGADVLYGGTGNDRLYGYTENLLAEDLLFGGDDNDYLEYGALSDGGAGDDSITLHNGTSLTIGGAGNDAVWNMANPDAGALDVYLFNRGDGQDRVRYQVYPVGYSSPVITPEENRATISLGGGIGYDDLTFTRQGADLILGLGGGDQITFTEWYQSSIGYGYQAANARGIYTLQLVMDAAVASDAPLYNKQVQQFDLLGLAGKFDQALVLDPMLQSWAIKDTLPEFHLNGSNSLAIGGALAYQYAKLGSLDALAQEEMRVVLDAAAFGKFAQTIFPSSVYSFELGNGAQEIADWAGIEVIRMGAGVLPQDVTVVRDGLDLLLVNANGSDSLRVRSWYADAGHMPLMNVIFNDSTVWSASDLTTQGLVVNGTDGSDVVVGLSDFANTLSGGAGNDTLTGGQSGDVLDGGLGADSLEGGAGNDTYVFNPGDGVDRITDSGGVDTLQFGSGITPDSLSFGLGSLLVRVGDMGDAIHIEGFNPDDPLATTGIEKFQFADGTILEAAELIGRGFDIGGTDGDDLLTGTAINDRITGEDGNDTLLGGAGNDRYIFNPGDGADTIVDASGSDTLFIGGNLTEANLEGYRIGDDMLIKLSGTTDSVTLTDWFAQGEGVIRIEFADGSFLDPVGIEGLLNRPPVAHPDTITIYEDGGVANVTAAALLANDTDPDAGDTLSLAGFDSLSALGNTVGMDAAGNLTFDIGDRYQSLAQGDTLTDSFGYTVSDTSGATATAQVAVTITGSNDGPVAADDAASVQEDAAAVTGNVLANDSDVDQGTILQVADAGTYQGMYGSLTLNADGSYAYQLDNASQAVQSLGRNAQVTEQFGYTATDGIVGASAVLDIFISGSNDAPIVAAPLADRNIVFNKTFSWQMPEGSFTDIDQGDTLAYSATLSDGTALPDWLVFDPATRTFTGKAPKQVGTVDVMVTATDATGDGSIQGSLSASDAFRITVGHGNEGVGNGDDAPPPGHHCNHNDGSGTSPGHPGSHGGNGHHDSDNHGRNHEHDKHKSDSHTHHGRDDNRIDELIRTWFEKGNTADHRDICDVLGRGDDRIEHQANRNVARGIHNDYSRQWAHMNAKLKEHMAQNGNDDHFETGASHGSPSLFGTGGYQGLSQLGKSEGVQMKAFAGLKEGLERLGC